MVYGVWCMVYGVWCMVDGVWYMVYGVSGTCTANGDGVHAWYMMHTLVYSEL